MLAVVSAADAAAAVDAADVTSSSALVANAFVAALLEIFEEDKSLYQHE